MYKPVALSSTMMLASIIGFMVSVYYVPTLSFTWGFTLTFFFVILFIASVWSMSNLEADDKYGVGELAIHQRRKKK